MQKATSSKLIPHRQTDYYNCGPYYSPKYSADYFLRAYK